MPWRQHACSCISCLGCSVQDFHSFVYLFWALWLNWLFFTFDFDCLTADQDTMTQSWKTSLRELNGSLKVWIKNLWQFWSSLLCQSLNVPRNDMAVLLNGSRYSNIFSIDNYLLVLVIIDNILISSWYNLVVIFC